MTFLLLLRSLQLSSNFIILLTLILFLSTTPVSIVFLLSSCFHVSPISSYHLQCHHPLTILFFPLLNYFCLQDTNMSRDTVFQHHSILQSPLQLQPVKKLWSHREHAITQRYHFCGFLFHFPFFCFIFHHSHCHFRYIHIKDIE